MRGRRSTAAQRVRTAALVLVCALAVVLAAVRAPALGVRVASFARVLSAGDRHGEASDLTASPPGAAEVAARPSHEGADPATGDPVAFASAPAMPATPPASETEDESPRGHDVRGRPRRTHADLMVFLN